MAQSDRTPRRWTIAHKIGVLCVVGVVASVALTFVARAGLGNVKSRMDAQVTTSQGLQNHMQGDMMHDALRADVLAAFEALTPADKDKVLTDVVDHSAIFKQAIADNKKLDLPASVRDALATISAPLDEYVAAANAEVKLVLADHAAGQANLPAFLTKFAAMEKAQADVSDAIKKVNAESKTHAAASVTSAQRTLLIALAVITLLVIALGLQVAKSITRPLRKSVDSLRSLASKDLTATLDITSNDELRDMADALNEAFGNLSEALGSISGDSVTVEGAATELASISQLLHSNATDSSNQAILVATAGEEVSANVSTVAAAIEQMTASVSEIASGSAEAAVVAQEAVGLASRTSESVNRLGEASAEIGNVVNVITTIAEQTNLLALNATIEAARAGDSGKGFAVVANEVKELATETAKATDDIARRVAAVQAETQEAVASIEQIADIIGRINDHQTTIAGAIEEQVATTAEIGRSVAEAAFGTTQIAEGISGVATSSASTVEGITNAQASADGLAVVAANLRRLVGEFSY
ncbi:MAG: methyl-accepting chemotaxis protein [Actinomycetota bacterium]|nr:methyl-accepting chemotaxis protein [Actinomycetota bacterium]